MGLRGKWTAARELDRQEREAHEARTRRYAKAEELRKLGVSVRTVAGRLDPALTEEALDAMVTAEKGRRAELYETFARAGTVTTFRALGIQILAGGDKVYTIGNHDPWTKTNGSRLLGPLAGAEAWVTDSTSAFSWGKAMVMPIATAPLARKETADAMVTFTDGTVHTFALDGSSALRDARKQCVQFNALTGAPAPATTGTGSDPAIKLRKLQELRDAGLLGQEEYDAKRAEVINSI
jgi:Short C-terminal domain